MAQRPARPVRFLQSSLVGLTSENTAPAIAVHKPIGLPYFAAHQVTAAEMGRRLFSSHGTPPVAQSDTSDSLLARLTDAFPPGRTPRVALPLFHPSLLRHCTAAQLNALTRQRSGATLVAASPAELHFMRNCHLLGLVRFVYRVVCRLPPCVVSRVRRGAKASKVKETISGEFKNPYVQQFIARTQHAHTSAEGMPLIAADGSSSLPRCARAHPLLRGGFFSLTGGRLLRQGSITGHCAAWQLPKDIVEGIESRRRLYQLFSPPTREVQEGEEGSGETCVMCKGSDRTKERESSAWEEKTHAWIPSACRLRIATDARSLALNGTPSSHKAQVLTKPFHFDFHLAALSESCEFALYEVTTRDATDEEIKAVFAASNLIVLNDFDHDSSLATGIEFLSQRLQSIPSSRLSGWPMALQHRLRHASPLELVVEPLQQHIESDGDICRAALLSELAAVKEESIYHSVAQLALGSGLECCALHLPNPALQTNHDAVQHLLLRQEERGVVPAYRDSVAERMGFITRTSSVGESEGTRCAALGPAGVKGLLPARRDIATAWANKCSTNLWLDVMTANTDTPSSALTMLALLCAYCGEEGHVWSQCQRTMPFLSPNSNSADAASLNRSEVTFMEEAFSNVDDVAELLERGNVQGTLNRGKSNPNELIVEKHPTDVGVIPGGDPEVVPIPNVAPTLAFNPHAWRRNSERPVLHRHRLRCAYCSGHHHITQCPKLDGGPSTEAATALDGVEKEKLHQNSDKLFCIRCGNRGHLLRDCPTIPTGLSPATHCPICSVSRTKILHEPHQCPRRVEAPRDCNTHGVPISLTRERQTTKSRRRRGGVLLSDSFLSQTR